LYKKEAALAWDAIDEIAITEHMEAIDLCRFIGNSLLRQTSKLTNRLPVFRNFATLVRRAIVRISMPPIGIISAKI
jgi:hypothetical protein